MSAWLFFLGPPVIGLAPAFLLRRWHRRRWTIALLVAAVALAAVFEGGLAMAWMTDGACLGDCYGEAVSTKERVGGSIIFMAGALLPCVGVIAIIAALAVALTGRDLRDREP